LRSLRRADSALAVLAALRWRRSSLLAPEGAAGGALLLPPPSAAAPSAAAASPGCSGATTAVPLAPSVPDTTSSINVAGFVAGGSRNKGDSPSKYLMSLAA
jgi:hypothetical protein